MFSTDLNTGYGLSHSSSSSSSSSSTHQTNNLSIEIQGPTPAHSGQSPAAREMTGEVNQAVQQGHQGSWLEGSGLAALYGAAIAVAGAVAGLLLLAPAAAPAVMGGGMILLGLGSSTGGVGLLLHRLPEPIRGLLPNFITDVSSPSEHFTTARTEVEETLKEIASRAAAIANGDSSEKEKLEALAALKQEQVKLSDLLKEVAQEVSIPLSPLLQSHMGALEELKETIEKNGTEEARSSALVTMGYDSERVPSQISLQQRVANIKRASAQGSQAQGYKSKRIALVALGAIALVAGVLLLAASSQITVPVVIAVGFVTVVGLVSAVATHALLRLFDSDQPQQSQADSARANSSAPSSTSHTAPDGLDEPEKKKRRKSTQPGTPLPTSASHSNQANEVDPDKEKEIDNSSEPSAPLSDDSDSDDPLYVD